MSERKSILLRLDPAVHDALARWAGDELRSTTAQIEFLLRQALAQTGRLPGNVGGLPRRGRPPKPGPGGGAGESGADGVSADSTGADGADAGSADADSAGADSAGAGSARADSAGTAPAG
jgi:hypothetical protein